MLEAMACGCVVIGSRTAPVQEVITHAENGYLVDFFDAAALAGQVLDVLRGGEQMDEIREAARDNVQCNYSVEQGVRNYMQVILE